jgi:catechol 2,3-dioxygenase-like lactoylglutathione lyase family enzyme
MVSKRGDVKPWMPADEYGRSLRGIGINLLVRDVARSVEFAKEVLLARVVYADADFAVLRYEHGRTAAEWMLHADHTYSAHPLLALTGDNAIRGAGCELRLYDMDPDEAVKRAGKRGDPVLQGATDKPHGLRECYIADPDGYVWVPGVPIGGRPG